MDSSLRRGALLTSLYIALAGGLGMVAVGAWQHWAGHRSGVAEATAERNSHWQGILGAMQAEQAKQLAAETAKVRDAESRMATAVRTAQEHLEYERQTNARLRGDVAAAVQRHDRLRDSIAAVATGGVAEADDTAAACRARADAIGRVLGEALQAHEQCSIDAEDLAAGVRALRAGWPRDGGERGGEVAPSIP